MFRSNRIAFPLVPAKALGHVHISSVEDTEVARNPSYWLITRSVLARGAGFAKSLFRLPNWKACACPSAKAGTQSPERALSDRGRESRLVSTPPPSEPDVQI